MSAATIRQIQKEYFDLLECYFAEERKEFEKAHISGWEKVLEYVGHDIAPRFKSGLTVQDSELGSVPSILYTVYQLLTGVRAFWSHIGDTLHSAILTSEALCCEITDSDPLETERHIKSHGLYFDTVCFKDPLYHLVRTFHPRQAASLYSFGLGAFFQYFLLISRKQLFVNESDFPIAVLYPEVSSEELLSEVEKNAYEKTRVFASELCDKEFSDPPEIVAHFGSCSFQNTYSRIKAGPLAMFCADLEQKLSRVANTGSTFEERLNFAVHSSRELSGIPELPKCKGAQSLHVSIFRNIQWLEMENYECAKLGALQSLDGQTWELYKWGLSKDAGAFARRAGIDEEFAILRAFDLPHLQWLANVEINDLIKIREKGQMEEMRSSFRVNRKRLKTATVDDFARIAGDVADSIGSAVTEYSRRLEEEEKRFQEERKRGLISFSVSAALGVASIALPHLLPLAVISLGYSVVVGGKSAKDLVNQHLSGKTRMHELSDRPIGILLRAKTAEGLS